MADNSEVSKIETTGDKITEQVSDAVYTAENVQQVSSEGFKEDLLGKIQDIFGDNAMEKLQELSSKSGIEAIMTLMNTVGTDGIEKITELGQYLQQQGLAGVGTDANTKIDSAGVAVNDYFDKLAASTGIQAFDKVGDFGQMAFDKMGDATMKGFVSVDEMKKFIAANKDKLTKPEELGKMANQGLCTVGDFADEKLDQLARITGLQFLDKMGDVAKERLHKVGDIAQYGFREVDKYSVYGSRSAEKCSADDISNATVFSLPFRIMAYMIDMAFSACGCRRTNTQITNGN
jgi:hypothetical protein